MEDSSNAFKSMNGKPMDKRADGRIILGCIFRSWRQKYELDSIGDQYRAFMNVTLNLQVP
mgnify:CR=1 FL=1